MGTPQKQKEACIEGGEAVKDKRNSGGNVI